MNNTTIAGRLTKDPDLRYTANGKAVANFTVAVNRPFKNTQGENEADFINCVAFGKQAENLANYMKKGSMVGVEGRIQTGSYENKEGRRIFTTDVMANQITFLESRKSDQPKQQQQQPKQEDMQPMDIDDSQLPF